MPSGVIKRHDYLFFGEELYTTTVSRTALQGHVTDALRLKSAGIKFVVCNLTQVANIPLSRYRFP
jgi:hypothetical protein